MSTRVDVLSLKNVMLCPVLVGNWTSTGK